MGLLKDAAQSPLTWGGLLVLGLCGAGMLLRRAPTLPTGSVELQPAVDSGVSQSFARADDLVLRARRGPALVIGASENEAAHRPLRGALVDVRYEASEQIPEELFLWWMPGFVDAAGAYHVPRADSVERHDCAGGTGIRVIAHEGDAKLVTDYCVVDEERFSIVTSADHLPSGAALADELAAGTSETVVDGVGEAFEDLTPSDFVVVLDPMAKAGGAAVFESASTKVEQHKIKIAAEQFPAPIHVRHPSAIRAERSVRLLRGDVFDALATRTSENRTVSVVAPELEGKGTLELLDEHGGIVTRGKLAGPSRILHLPKGLGHTLRVRDQHGVVQGEKELAKTGWTDAEFTRQARGAVHFALTDETRTPIAAHVLIKGMGGTPDPHVFRTSHVYGAGRSVYLPHGSGEVHLPPGEYMLTAAHGTTHTLLQRAVSVQREGVTDLSGQLRRVIDGSDWTTADFHLHASPSPDSKVPLEDRVVSLACAGIDFAVPTDHNRITDYNADIDRLDLRALASFPGVEITTSGKPAWGHFNAYPLLVPQDSQERAVPPYYDTTPGAIFHGARERGARVIQANHVRMPPRIGYFDLAEFDAKTGQARSKDFSDAFDALEVYNGIWIQDVARIREGAHDLIGLARRGKHPAATGNSDSHTLLYEEAGWPRTWVHTPREPRETRGARVLDALLAGKTSVSSGPLVELTVQGAEPGGTVHPPDGTASVTIRVTAPAWVSVDDIELWADDDVVWKAAADAPKDGVRFERTFSVPVDHDVVMLAWVRGKQPLPDVLPYERAESIAFTGLVYVDADGDGAVKLREGH
jgi:hypothetical protein